MARTKESRGLDYFSIDTEWDKKVKLIQMKFGMVGIGVIVTLYQSIYRESCFMSWDEDSQILFAASIQIELSKLKEIISYAAEKEVFDASILTGKGVLTSHGIQKHWLAVVTRAGRKDCTIPDEINLLAGNFQDEESVRSPHVERTKACADKAKAKAKVEFSKSEQSELRSDPEEDFQEPDAPPARSPVSLDFLKKKIQGSKYPLSLVEAELERIANRFAEIDLTAQDLDPLMDYLIDRVDRGAKKNPKGLLMKALLEYDWHLDFQSERPKPKKPRKASTPAFPDPGPCSCGGMLIVGGEKNDMARCTKCGARYEFDPELSDPEIGETGWIKLSIPDKSSG